MLLPLTADGHAPSFSQCSPQPAPPQSQGPLLPLLSSPGSAFESPVSKPRPSAGAQSKRAALGWSNSQLKGSLGLLSCVGVHTYNVYACRIACKDVYVRPCAHVYTGVCTQVSAGVSLQACACRCVHFPPTCFHQQGGERSQGSVWFLCETLHTVQVSHLRPLGP